MVLAFNYEEVTALSHGARAFLHEERDGDGASVAAPSAAVHAVEVLLPRLTGDLSVRTLGEQQNLEEGIEAVLAHLRTTMQSSVLATHPAAEEAVAAYFDYAHVLAVLGRVREMGAEMRALFEVMTGKPAVGQAAMSFVFPD